MTRASLDMSMIPVGELAPRAAAGGRDERRIRNLVQTHFQFVWRSLRRLGVSAAVADDAAQQVFLVTIAKLDTIAPDREKSFLFGTAMRIASDARRAQVRHEARSAGEGSLASAADGSPDPEDALDAAGRRVMLDEVLDAMPSDIRQVFVLYELEGMTAPEVAGAIAIPLGTVASRLRRGRELFHEHAARLRARLQREEASR